MNKTGISWCDYSWNPVKGCTKISSGCANCYAEKMAKRLAAMGVKGYNPKHPFLVAYCPEKLDQPLKVKKPSNIFVASMADLFHELVPDCALEGIRSVIDKCPQHNFLILTKRTNNTMFNEFTRELPSNVWLGVTVESDLYRDRIDRLIATGHSNLYVSLEPLLGPIDITPYLNKLKWVIVGAESGPGRRECDLEWVETIFYQCCDANVPVFYKQGPDDSGKWCKEPSLKGQYWLQFPEALKR